MIKFNKETCLVKALEINEMAYLNLKIMSFFSRNHENLSRYLREREHHKEILPRFKTGIVIIPKGLL